MHWQVTTPPVARPIDYLAMKPHLRIFTDRNDTTALIESYIDAAIDYAETMMQCSLAEAYQFIASRAVVDESGARIFADGDLAELAKVDFADLNEIALAVLKFSGMQGVEADPKNA